MVEIGIALGIGLAILKVYNRYRRRKREADYLAKKIAEEMQKKESS